MQKTTNKKQAALLGALCAVLTLLGFILYSGVILKTAGLLAGAGAIWALAVCDVKPLRSPYTWPLLGFLAFAALTGFWALSGKLFLEGYMQIFTAGAVFLILLLRPRFGEETARRVLSVIAVTAAAYAFLGVEAATTGVTKALLRPLLGEKIRMTFTSIRLYGVFGNPNVEASVFAFGVIFSLALLVGARTRRERILFASTLSLSACALLMTFSLGALFFFAVSMAVYLAAAGETRGEVFARMLEGAAPALVCALFSAVFGGREGFTGKLPLLILLCAAGTAVWLELHVAERAAARLEKGQKLLFALLAALIVLVLAYFAIGFSVSGPYTFGGRISRTFYTAPGEHTMTIDASGKVRVYVYSQNHAEAVDARRNYIYKGRRTKATFTVPEDSISCTLILRAEEGVTVNSVTLDGEKTIPLDYPLLPEFVVSRLQGVRTSSSVLQRKEMMQDGLALWRMHPVLGNGIGSFEVGKYILTRSTYQTKYVHNNYIQTLLETGVIGFALWLGALAAPVVLLLRARRNAAHPTRWAYGALWAAMSMTLLQPVTDVSLSFCVALWYVFAVFALILRLYAPAPAEEPQAAEGGKKERRAAEEAARARRSADATLRVAASSLIALFLITVLGAVVAERMCNTPVSSMREQLGRLATGVKLDLYNGDSYRYSYVLFFASDMNEEEGTAEEYARADEFAREMAQRPSRDASRLLAAYYHDRGWYDESIEAAKSVARAYPSDRKAWEQIAPLLSASYGRADTPLLGADGAALMDSLMEYRALLDAYNETAYTPLVLDEETEAFFAKLPDARAHAGDTAYLTALFASK